MTLPKAHRITLTEARKALRKAIKLRGYDYRYPYLVFAHDPDEEGEDVPGCVYVRNDERQGYSGWGDEVEDGGCACLIGVALNFIDPELVPEMNTMTADSIGAGTLIEDYLHSTGYSFTEKAFKLLTNAQLYQDDLNTWGYSVMQAERDLEEDL